MNKLTAEQITAIRQRTESATTGPWHTTKCDCGHPACNTYFLNIAGSDGRLDPNDALFIANARHDIPILLAEVDRLNEELRNRYAEGYAMAKFDCAMTLTYFDYDKETLANEWAAYKPTFEEKLNGGATEWTSKK
jgi:hypothetical protein